MRTGPCIVIQKYTLLDIVYENYIKGEGEKVRRGVSDMGDSLKKKKRKGDPD